VSLASRQLPSEPPKPAWTSVRALITAQSDRGRGRLEPFAPVAEQIAFLAEHDVPPALLAAATRAATAAGVTAEQALFGEGLMREEEFYRLLARHLNVPYFCGALQLAPCSDPASAATRDIALLAPNPHKLRYVVAPRGATLTMMLELAEANRLVPSFVVTSPQRLGAIFRAQMSRQIVDDAALALDRADPALSARSRLSKGQMICGGLLALATLSLGFFRPDALAVLLAVVLWILFAATVGLRFAALAINPASLPCRPLEDQELPVYSIIVPLLREAGILDRLIPALDAIDYPRSKLDIKIVLEEDDLETLVAVARMRLPSRYEVIVAPRGDPSTKPRALNIALPSIRGEFVVVYDAEDKPAPDQLRRAAARFVDQGAVDCLQARLVVQNVDSSWLTRLFALEYCALFDVLIPGLASIGAPFPLGGTSNHFRSSALRRVGGWDAWNVTEDADLGFRLARFGCRAAALDSDTFEEAPIPLRAWFKQRCRWQKGWLQTFLVHSRAPRRLFREMGCARALATHIVAIGAVLGGMLGPALTIVALWRCCSGGSFGASALANLVVGALVWLLLVAGLQSIVVPIVLSAHGRGWQKLYRYLPLLPVYYCLISIAAWAALIELARRPHYWSKTEHGLTRMAAHACSHIRDRNISHGIDARLT
jgi:cellulose synthase/poly-beta-1,6-N-acetylglucosamine synthase-like glycosyltransferase